MPDIKPTVSVIVPNYNHAPYLKQRIDSVLAQTYGDFELILLDDCSTDDSRTILESFRGNSKVSSIIYNETNSGSTFAQWRKGLAAARGEYVWIAESDDYAEPEFLATLVDALDRNPSAALAFTGSTMVDSDGKPIEGMDWDRYKAGAPAEEVYSGDELLKRKLLWTADIYNASMVLFRRTKAPEITPRQMAMRYCGDWLFWVEMTRNGGGVEVRRKLNNFRQHNAKVSPGASKSGLYFIEGLPVMVKVADYLNLSPTSRSMLAGRTLKRLSRFPDLVRKRGEEIYRTLGQLSAGSPNRRRRLILLYELDKYLNFTNLQPR